MPNKKKILIVSPQVHTRPFNGTGMRAHYQAVHLSDFFSVTVVSDTGSYKVENGLFVRLSDQVVAEGSKIGAYIASFLAGTHYSFAKFNCRKWNLPDFRLFDCVILHYAALLEFMMPQYESGPLIILDTHNNDREYFESIAAKIRNPLIRFAMKMQANSSERLIKKWSSNIAATVSVSENDRKWVQGLTDDATQHFVVPNNLFKFAPTNWGGQNILLYVGTLNVEMNLQALGWFRTYVWPTLTAQSPELQLIVAGRDPSVDLQRQLVSEGIQVVGNPESLVPLYEMAMLSIVPALSGSGGKIKVCESLAHAVPILTTSHGVIGQPDAIRSCCLVHEQPSEWVDVILRQLQHAERNDPDWIRDVESALAHTYFGATTGKIVDFIQSSHVAA